MDYLFLDFETQSEVDVSEVGTPNYARHPSTKPILLSWAINRGKVHVWECQDEPMPAGLRRALLDPNTLKLAWNVNFERSIFEQCLNLYIPINQWFDVRVLARYWSLPGKLKDACRAMELPPELQKMAEEGEKLIHIFSEPAREHEEMTLFGVRSKFDGKADRPAEWAQFREYNAQDTKVEQHIFYALGELKSFPQEELDNWYLDQDINRRGLPLAVKFVENALKMALASRENLRAVLAEKTGLENPNSDDQMLGWLQGQGYKYNSLNKTMVRIAMLAPEKLTPLALEVLTIRKEFKRSSYTKLESMLQRVSDDGYIRDCFAFMGGARTGRWAGQDMQFQNLAKPNKQVEEHLDEAMAFIWANDFEGAVQAFSPTVTVNGQQLVIRSCLSMVISCIRSVFQAKPGYLLIVSDYSAIENRILGWLTGCQPILDVFEKKLDPYISFACLMYKLAYEHIDKAERTVAKPAVLGCGYGLGPGVRKNPDGTYTIIWKCDECRQEVAPDHYCTDKKTGKPIGNVGKTGLLGYGENMGVNLTPEQAYNAWLAFRNAYPEVPEFWWTIEQAVIKVLHKGGTEQVSFVSVDRLRRKDGTVVLRIHLPSGRCLHYINARVQASQVQSKRTGRFYTKYSIFYDGVGHGVGSTTGKQTKWSRVYTYGGKLTENIVQAIARDLLAYGMRLVKAKGFPIVGHVHDEVVTQVKNEPFRLTIYDLNQCLTVVPRWAKGLPLGAEGYEGQVYRKG